MAQDSQIDRRTVLQTVGAAGSLALGVGTAGAAPAQEQRPDGESIHTSDTSPIPVVDNSGAPEQTVSILVTVTDTAGAPLSDEQVKLEDRGGTPDDRYGSTGPTGQLLFLESVGPSPCNTQTLKLPDRNESADLGCNNGGVHLGHTFEVTTSPPPIVDNGGAPEQTVTVDVLVEDQQGNPVENEIVKLEDRGGTPDNRYGVTGPLGRLRFLEAVGPAPCNTQTLKLVNRDGKTADLGCNNGGVELSHTFIVSE